MQGVKTIYPAFLHFEQNKLLTSSFEYSDKKSILLTSLIKLLEKRSIANQRILEWGKNEERKDNVAWLKTLNENHDKMLTSFTAVDIKTGLNGLAQLIKGEVLSTKLNEKGTFILYLKVVVAGGNIKITKGWTFRKVYHSGGAIITYFLLDKDRGIIASKTLYNVTGYKTFKEAEGEPRLKNF